jgi:hypothetical protein
MFDVSIAVTMKNAEEWRNVPEDTILHSHRCENLKSYIVLLYGEATHRHIWRLEMLRTKRTKLLWVLARTTGRNIPEDAILHSHCRENLKPYNEECCLLGYDAAWLL